MVDAALVAAAAGVTLSGAALWAVACDGTLCEHVSGRRNAVSPAAFLDLMPPADRAALLRPAIAMDRYDRGDPPLTPAQVRAAWQAGFGRHRAIARAAA